ncbi:guanylate cyclase [Elysia marginata]|uniref:Guanylate cyclase n=1 Tax=Elysia marginata TaxID=1093978 RepID=A0AAV4J7J8_9GAST|nr:guanylate cyclase [Elysia marginata]
MLVHVDQAVTLVSRDSIEALLVHVDQAVTLVSRDDIDGYGNLVRQHSVGSGQFQVNAKVLREFEEIRDLNHPNLLRVVGAVLEGDKKVLVTEHCPKGSLQVRRDPLADLFLALPRVVP